MKIIYQHNGSWVSISAAPGFDLGSIAASTVPHGLTWEIVEDDDARLTISSTPTICPTCGGSGVDPEGVK